MSSDPRGRGSQGASHDYLWDGAGAPNPETQRLEQALGRFRHRGLPPVLPEAEMREIGSAQRRRAQRTIVVAAVAGLAVAAALVLMFRPREPAALVEHTAAVGPSGWTVVRLEGAPQVSGRAIDEKTPLGVGGWLETNGHARARLEGSGVGHIEVEPDSRVGLRSGSGAEHRLTLSRGKIRATIWAPPRVLSVETPSAVAVDLGCAYTLAVADDGVGRLHVETGWVAFETQGRESFVPAGAACTTWPGVGPGTPYFADASPVLRAALESLDRGRDASALAVVLREAGARDGLTLWHLLTRVAAGDRPAVHDRLAALVPPPRKVTRNGIVAGNRAMLDAWWAELGLGASSFWREWKRPAPTVVPAGGG